MTDRRTFLNILFKTAIAIEAMPLIPKEEILYTVITNEGSGIDAWNEWADAEKAYILKELPKLFEKDSVFFSALERNDPVTIVSCNMVIPLNLKKGGYFEDYEE